MSAKRISSSAIDWVAFAARVPKDQKPQFNNFKGKCDGYLRSVNALPESLPKIHWEQYTSRVAVPGMVDTFKKQYESIKVPYPEDKFSAKISEVEKSAMAKVAEFVVESDKRIAEHKKELEKWESMMPISEMTIEEFIEHFPEQGFDPEKPSMYPHTPESQPGYVHKEEGAEH